MKEGERKREKEGGRGREGGREGEREREGEEKEKGEREEEREMQTHLPYSSVTMNGCLISARMSLSIFVRTLSRTERDMKIM